MKTVEHLRWCRPLLSSLQSFFHLILKTALMKKISFYQPHFINEDYDVQRQGNYATQLHRSHEQNILCESTPRCMGPPRAVWWIKSFSGGTEKPPQDYSLGEEHRMALSLCLVLQPLQLRCVDYSSSLSFDPRYGFFLRLCDDENIFNHSKMNPWSCKGLWSKSVVEKPGGGVFTRSSA